jgi:hypothetical protein
MKPTENVVPPAAPMPSSRPRKWKGARGLAEELGCSISQAEYLLARRRVPAKKLGRNWFGDCDQLHESFRA